MTAQTVREDAPKVRTASKSAKALYSLLKDTASNWMEDNAMRLSAALSLYTLLSLAPLLVISIKVIAVVAGGKKATATITHQVQNLMGSKAAEAVQPMIENGGKHGSGVVAAIVSTVLLVFSATGVFVELQDSMNTIWGVKPKPNQGVWNFVRTRMLSVGMVFGIGFLLLVSMLISTVLANLAHFIARDVTWLAIVGDIIVTFGVVFLLFAGIFKFLPDVKLAWKHVWSGALLTTVLFTLGKYGLTLYFRYGTPTSAFGAAGSLAAVLLWVYYSAFILFFGTEFTKVWSMRQDGGILPDDHAVQVTEEQRAREGIPSEERVQIALANSAPEKVGPVGSTGRGGKARLDGSTTKSAQRGRLAIAGCAVGGAGLAIGIIVGRSSKSSLSDAGVLGLNDRLNTLDASIRRAARANR